jgi:hypothetical protein
MSFLPVAALIVACYVLAELWRWLTEESPRWLQHCVLWPTVAVVLFCLSSGGGWPIPR